MPLSPESLADLVQHLATRPGHEAVRVGVSRLLVDGLGARPGDVLFEQPVKEVRGRVDALVGRTVFEFKSNLRRERADAEEQLTRYLAEREAATRERYVGVATDGATFVVYDLQDGQLTALQEFRAETETPNGLLLRLSSVVVAAEEMPPEPDAIRAQLGRGSVAWIRARNDMRRMYEEVSTDPEVRTKRALWSQLLGRVYGSPVDDDDLFFQHTYLTAIAKTMAAHVIGSGNPSAADLLSGRLFEQANLYGVAESDFFDWVLRADGGTGLVERIALQVGIFRLAEVRTDVLKGLYESLIDPEQRHVLGEYYTPDWLAERICATAVRDPLNERVVDPACGSGTFLFHAVRRLLMAADEEGMSNADALARCCDRVLGIDVHPVAVQIARVTYLLALGDRLRRERGFVTLPVYLGDSMQWNTEPFLADRDVLIEAPPDEATGADAATLHFPAAVARDPALFDQVINRMLEMSANSPPQPSSGLTAWLGREGINDEPTQQVLAETYEQLAALRQEGRNHIWGFAARNLVRPVWLGQQDQRPSVLVGNPPWLSYRFMDKDTQRQFRTECQELGIWTGRQVSSQQDLAAYFYVRCAELYLQPGGRIAFVMPYASMSRQAFEGFLDGSYPPRLTSARSNKRRLTGRNVRNTLTTLRFTDAWVLSDEVKPLFRVPSCVLFAEMSGMPAGIGGANVMKAEGTLPRRDASAVEAHMALTWQPTEWPASLDITPDVSPYHDEFHNGATMFPRLLCIIERPPSGALGINTSVPIVQSRRSKQEKAPWKQLPSLIDNVENEFLRRLYLGESITPFRTLNPVEAIIPWHTEHGLMDAAMALSCGFPHLARWMRQAEGLWEEYKSSDDTLVGYWNYDNKLKMQLPSAKGLRVVYAKSGTLPTAVVVHDTDILIENTLYWTIVSSLEEGRYLMAVLNSETARKRTEPLQSRGQLGPRHFDRYMLQLPIPRFDSHDELHLALASQAAYAEEVAASVDLREGLHFVQARQEVRSALAADGVARHVDELVVQLLE